MEVRIITKYNLGDEVYVFDGGLNKMVVRDISISYDALYVPHKSKYLCEKKDNKMVNGWYVENDVYSKDELRRIFNMVCDEDAGV